eukprot:m.54311 g.54311  ORF g.54311 m.54311 type:complete len:70 (+) comp21888_c0_seq1:1003-1212(+)
MHDTANVTIYITQQIQQGMFRNTHYNNIPYVTNTLQHFKLFNNNNVHSTTIYTPQQYILHNDVHYNNAR